MDGLACEVRKLSHLIVASLSTVHPIQHGDSVLLVESSARPGPLVGIILFLLFGRIGACILLSVPPLYPEIPFVTPRIDLAQWL